MIQNESIHIEEISHHYDELDEFYRELWGTHLHHGLWKDSKESKQEAVENLSIEVLSHLNPLKGKKLIDIGCGYGETSRLAIVLGAKEVTGLTISKKQYEFAIKNSIGLPLRFKLQDWTKNDLASQSFDGAYCIECFDHVINKAEFFQEVKRTLKPGSTLSMAAWLSSSFPSEWDVKHILTPICEEGRLPSLCNREDLIALAEDSGLVFDRHIDLSSKVWRTWSISAGEMFKIFGQKKGIKYFLNSKNSERKFALTVLRILLGYKKGAFKYGAFVFKVP